MRCDSTELEGGGRGGGGRGGGVIRYELEGACDCLVVLWGNFCVKNCGPAPVPCNVANEASHFFSFAPFQLTAPTYRVPKPSIAFMYYGELQNRARCQSRKNRLPSSRRGPETYAATGNCSGGGYCAGQWEFRDAWHDVRSPYAACVVVHCNGMQQTLDAWEWWLW